MARLSKMNRPPNSASRARPLQADRPGQVMDAGGLIDSNRADPRGALPWTASKERSRTSMDSEDMDTQHTHDEHRGVHQEAVMNSRGHPSMNVNGRPLTPWWTSCVNSWTLLQARVEAARADARLRGKNARSICKCSRICSTGTTAARHAPQCPLRRVPGPGAPGVASAPRGDIAPAYCGAAPGASRGLTRCRRASCSPRQDLAAP